MEPRIHTGDVVGEERIVPAQVRSGDIVTFQDPDEKGRMITHRVRSVRERAGVYSVVTKGDANNTVERWTIAADGQLGRVRYRVAHVGHLPVFTRGPFGPMALGLPPALPPHPPASPCHSRCPLHARHLPQRRPIQHPRRQGVVEAPPPTPMHRRQAQVRQRRHQPSNRRGVQQFEERVAPGSECAVHAGTEPT